MAHVLASELRESVLRAALEGKLTTQSSNDTPVYVTLDKVKEIKKHLIKKGEMKKEKPLKPVNDDEQNFDIPDGWIWTRMQNFLDVRDGTHDSPKYVADGYPFVTSKNLINGSISFDNVQFITKEDFEKFNARSRVDVGDILMAMIGSIGKPVLVREKNREFAIKNVALIKYVPGTGVNMNYVLYLLNYAESIMKSQANGGVQQFVSLSYLRNFPVPLPPIEEQARIVARVDELMAKIDEYEKLENELVELKKNFPGDMKAAVLQAAMQGKLTEQLKEDSKVKALETLARILPKYKVPENNEYDLPESWQCVKIADVMKIVNGFTPLRSNTSFWNSKDIPWFTIDDIRTQGRFINSTNQYISNEAVGKSSKRILPKDSILLCCTASVGEYAYSNIELTTNQQFNGLVRKPEFVNMIEPMYVYYFVQTLKTKLLDNSGSTTFSFLSTKKLGEFLLPLPPIEEQKRIVEKLDKILPLCEELEKEVV